MSLLSHLSQNLFSGLFGKKKENKREVQVQDETSNSIPSFSILNHSLSKNSDNDYLRPESAIPKRENIFFGKDIESNDTNEIIDYNLRKLRKNSEVITTHIGTSTESGKLKPNNTIVNTLDTEKKNDTNLTLNKDTNEKQKVEENSPENKSDIESDNKSESESDTENENDSDLSSNSDTDSDSDAVDTDEDKSTICSNQNQSGTPLQKKETKKSKHSRHSSIDDIILEDFDMDKLIYNVPPPFIKVNNPNPLDSIPVIKFNDSISVPASLTMSKYRNTNLSNSYSSRNILSSSVSSNGDRSLTIPGIRTIELKRPKSNNDPKRTSQAFSFGKRRLSGVPIATSFSPKELSAPLSTSLLALQNEQPSFASLISEETPSNDPSNDADSSFYVIDEEDSEDDYDIFNYSMKEL